MATLKAWTHQTTGERRVYAAGLIRQGFGDKVWFERAEKDCFGTDWVVRVKTIGTGPVAFLKNQAEDLITKTPAGHVVVTFDQILDRVE